MTYKGWILCRISSTDQIQGDSLELQEEKGKELLLELGLLPHEIKVFREVFSGRKDDRPVFNQVMTFSKTHQASLQYGCIFDIDRFSRAGAGFYEQTKNTLKQMGIQLIDANRVIQPERNMLEGSGRKFGADFEYEWSRYSPSEANEIQRAQQAKDEVRKILLRVVSNQINYVQNGYEGRYAGYGFKNVKVLDPETGRIRAMIQPHPEEAKYLIKMYEYAIMIHQNTLTIGQACKRINAMGYRSRRFNKWNVDKTRVIGTLGGAKLDSKQFWQYVQRINNAGFNCEKWTHRQLVPKKSPRLIPIDVWNKANINKYKIIPDTNSHTGWRLLDLKNGHKRNYKLENPHFPYKGLIRCSKCNKTLYAAFSRGKSGKRFPLYYCNRKHKQVSFNPKELHKLLHSFFKDFALSENTLNIIESGLKYHFLGQIKYHRLCETTRKAQIEKLKEKAQSIYDKISYLTNKALVTQCELDYENTIAEIAQLEALSTESTYTEEDIKLMIANAIKLLEHLDQILLNTDNQEVLRGFWSCIFLEKPTFEELTLRTPKLSQIVQLKGVIDDRKDGWYKDDELMRTLFEELVRWNDVLKRLIPLLRD